MERNNIGFGSFEREGEDDNALKNCSSEFRNRLDAVIKFDKLAEDTMKSQEIYTELNTMTSKKM